MMDANLHLLARHHDRPDAIGTEPGDECGRYAEPDEDAPRGYRPRPCTGTITDDYTCDTCGERKD